MHLKEKKNYDVCAGYTCVYVFMNVQSLGEIYPHTREKLLVVLLLNLARRKRETNERFY